MKFQNIEHATWWRAYVICSTLGIPGWGLYARPTTRERLAGQQCFRRYRHVDADERNMKLLLLLCLLLPFHAGAKIRHIYFTNATWASFQSLLAFTPHHQSTVSRLLRLAQSTRRVALKTVMRRGRAAALPIGSLFLHFLRFPLAFSLQNASAASPAISYMVAESIYMRLLFCRASALVFRGVCFIFTVAYRANAARHGWRLRISS